MCRTTWRISRHRIAHAAWMERSSALGQRLLLISVGYRLAAGLQGEEARLDGLSKFAGCLAVDKLLLLEFTQCGLLDTQQAHLNRTQILRTRLRLILVQPLKLNVELLCRGV